MYPMYRSCYCYPIQDSTTFKTHQSIWRTFLSVLGLFSVVVGRNTIVVLTLSVVELSHAGLWDTKSHDDYLEMTHDVDTQGLDAISTRCLHSILPSAKYGINEGGTKVCCFYVADLLSYNPDCT
jgi:hypothetical protein